MKYQHHEVSFEIPNSWLVEASVVDFCPPQESYVPAVVGDEEIIFVNFTEFEPLVERSINRGVFCDNHDTGDTAKLRVMRILSWLNDNHPIEPVKVLRSENTAFNFKLVEGSHRFHCALALGFKTIPATMA